MQLIHPINQDNKQAPVILSAGGTWIKLWDPLTGSCLAAVPTKHSKTITSVCMTTIIRDDLTEDDDGKEVNKKVYNRRILTAGLDGLIRIHSADDIFTAEPGQVKRQIQLIYVHGIKFAKAITAMSFSPDNNRLVIGFSDGKVTVRQKAKVVLQGAKRKSKIITPKAGTFSFFLRGANAPADADDHVVQAQKKKKLQKFDDSLKKFRYADALDEATSARDPNAVLAVIEELGRRRGLTLALSNRDEETLEPILSFTVNFISNPRYAPLLIGVANILCDIYGNIMGQSEVIDELFQRLRRNIKGECATQKILTRLLGQIDVVMYTAQEQEQPDYD
jgi:U3 small nucleolar RNA-associated protein 15